MGLERIFLLIESYLQQKSTSHSLSLEQFLLNFSLKETTPGKPKPLTQEEKVQQAKASRDQWFSMLAAYQKR